jgi:hypothetical protein
MNPCVRRIYNTFIGLVNSYYSGKMHVNKMEEATTQLENIISDLKTEDEILQLEGAVDTETGQKVKKRKVSSKKENPETATYKKLEKKWSSFKFLTGRPQFQLRYEKVVNPKPSNCVYFR